MEQATPNIEKIVTLLRKASAVQLRVIYLVAYHIIKKPIPK